MGLFLDGFPSCGGSGARNLFPSADSQFLGPGLTATASELDSCPILAIVGQVFRELARGDSHHVDGIRDSVSGSLVTLRCTWHTTAKRHTTMVWLTLGLTTLLGLLLVWIATQENRSARILGAASVLAHTLMLIGGLGMEPTSIWVTVAGLIAVVSQATVLGVVTLWIATRQSRVGRVIGGSILAVLSMALTYGMIFGPSVEDQRPECCCDYAHMDLGTAETRFGTRLRPCVSVTQSNCAHDPAEEGFWIRRCRLQSRVARFSRNLGLDEIFGMCAS